MEIGRRSLLKGAVGSAAAALLSPAKATADQEKKKVKPPPEKPARPPLPDSCFVNLNQPQRYHFTGSADMEGRTRFPMLDTRQIREIEGAEMRFHQAEKHGDPVMTADPRLERGTCIYGTVHHDGEHFRMWYQPIPLASQGAGNPYDVAYAESTDGVHWERPNLGLVERGGSKNNNLVTFRGHGPSVIDLGTAAPPEKRYLGIAVGYAPILGVPEVLTNDQTKKHHGYWMYYSADALNWKVYPPPTCAILNYMSDTACFIGDPYRNRVLGSVKLEPRVRLFDRRSVTITTARMVEVFHGKPEGRRIVVNARAAADGAVRVEAREATSKASKPIPGFTANDSKPITGDGVRLAVSWGGKGWTHLPKSPNIVLRFQLKKAELFAYEIEV